MIEIHRYNNESDSEIFNTFPNKDEKQKLYRMIGNIRVIVRRSIYRYLYDTNHLQLRYVNDNASRSCMHG